MSDFDVLESEDIEDYELDEELALLVESDEEARRARVRRRPVRTGSGAGYYRPRPAVNKYVTQAQLQSALAKISKDVKANATGIKSVGVRVDAVAAEQKRQAEAAKKDAAKRRDELGKLKSGLQMAAILPLVTSKSIEVTSDTTIGGAAVQKGTKLQVAPDTLSALLPMMLLGDGLGGGGGDSSNSLLLVLALSGGLSAKK